MPRALVATACLLLSLSGRLLAQPTTTSDREPPMSPAPAAAPRSPLAEPSSCTLRTCHLALERSWPNYVLRRGLPGEVITRLGWTLGDFEEAMASNPEALAALRGASRARVVTWLSVLAFAPVAYAAARTETTNRPLSPGMITLGGVALVTGVVSDEVWMRRIQEAIRIYNAGLPDGSPP